MHTLHTLVYSTGYLVQGEKQLAEVRYTYKAKFSDLKN